MIHESRPQRSFPSSTSFRDDPVMFGRWVASFIFPLAVWALPDLRELKGTKVFDLTVTWQEHAPDGVSRHMLLVNGKTPGPAIEVDQDDWVVVNVWNQSPFNTTVHFHGIEMKKTPWSDGVPGVSQRPVAPGSSFTYAFQATQYGSHWYHSHARGQIEDGLYGRVLIHPRPGTQKPFQMISDDPRAVRRMEKAERAAHALMVSDYMHITSEEKSVMTPRAGVEISCYDSILFNGKGRVRCLPVAEMTAHLSPVQKADLALVPGQTLTDKGCLPAIVLAAFGGNVSAYNASAIPPGVYHGCRETRGLTEVVRAPGHGADSWVALDVVGAVNYVSGVVAIDDHDMWIYAVDGSYIEPQRVQALALSNGERYSVLVRPTRPGDFQIRFHASSAPQIIVGNAILRVPGLVVNPPEPRQYIDLVGNPSSPDVALFDQATARPFPADPIARTADALYVLNMRLDGSSYRWALNTTGLDPAVLSDTDPPLLLSPNATRFKNATVVTRNNTWVDLILLASEFPQPPHPIHKHGVKMYRIGSGTGPFRWKSVEDARREMPDRFNLENPPRRDTFVSMPARDSESWIAVRYHVTDPGAWLLHCHIENHRSGGMMLVILDGVDAWPDIPPAYRDYS
ncbi:laccase [Metarhizium album ARSEF 1941]|uniref:Laccase 1 n=1 Tax=Metarhizium album (strain ARSEF 1941) TaxID=1081103 RepID=A0A0B2WPF8_METAS|nr:laccase [Metarhizium album ARSEF 1941]KHN94875.1 laccase [Metarhizium album ARSEF 1941]